MSPPKTLQTQTEKKPPADKISISAGLHAWLSENKISFAFTSYDAGSLYLIGENSGNLSLNQIRMGRSMGLCFDAGALHVAGRDRIYSYENWLENGRISNGFDAVYIMRREFFTGNLDIHELSVDGEGDFIFANTNYSCVATLWRNKSFKIVWKPEFISYIAPEDRCHLNGIGLENGKLRYASVVSVSDVLHGWRSNRTNGGMIIDIREGQKEGIIGGLSMPHSPRSHNGELFYHDSGRGYFMRGIEKICFCPGFLRGLSFHKNFALATVSLPRDGIFQGLELEGNLKKRGGEAWCGVLIIDLNSGSIIHWLRIEGDTRELFDCVWLDGIRCPGAFAPSDPAVQSRIAWEE